MVADAAVVAAVMCSESHVDLQVSEGPGLFDDMETGPRPKGPEPGEVLHLPILSDIGDTDFKGPSLVFGDVPHPPVSVGGIISGPGPPELGDTMGLPDFSADIDPGPGESFPWSGSVLVRPVILDDCVPDPGYTGWTGFCQRLWGGIREALPEVWRGIVRTGFVERH